MLLKDFMKNQAIEDDDCNNSIDQFVDDPDPNR